MALALAAGGCAGAPTQPLDTAQQTLRTIAERAGATDLSARRLPDGGMTIGGMLDGHQFALAIPAHWNHEALVFAHGYSMPGSPVAVSESPTEKDPSGGLMKIAYGQGYAVGHSAYDKAGMGVQSGVENTLRLKRYLDRLGARRVFVGGGSMGGNIVMALIEQHPDTFAGAVAACGVTDNWVAEVGALIDMRAAYNYFTAGTDYALPGNRDLDASAISATPPGIIGFAGSPYRLLQMKRMAGPIAALFKAVEKVPDGPEARMVARIASVTGFAAEPGSFIFPLLTVSLGMDDMRATFGGNIYDNRQKRYASPLLNEAEIIALNRSIQRTRADPAAIAYVDRWHRTTGRFTTPLVAIHNRIDSLVPYAQALGLRRRVRDANNTERLLQFTVPPVMNPIPGTGVSGYAHCGFRPAQIAQGWNALRQWVATGVKPAGGVRQP